MWLFSKKKEEEEEEKIITDTKETIRHYYDLGKLINDKELPIDGNQVLNTFLSDIDALYKEGKIVKEMGDKTISDAYRKYRLLYSAKIKDIDIDIAVNNDDYIIFFSNNNKILFSDYDLSNTIMFSRLIGHYIKHIIERLEILFDETIDKKLER